jgi:hypothetical protein
MASTKHVLFRRGAPHTSRAPSTHPLPSAVTKAAAGTQCREARSKLQCRSVSSPPPARRKFPWSGASQRPGHGSDAKSSKAQASKRRAAPRHTRARIPKTDAVPPLSFAPNRSFAEPYSLLPLAAPRAPSVRPAHDSPRRRRTAVAPAEEP